jgi:formylglycine-generating enzyme required for sulfatase activity
VAKCGVFLAVIGRDWLRGKGRKGKSRLEDPGDFVRIEIESALKRQIPVIPVLVGGAKSPPAERLPASIQDVSYRNGIVVRPDPDFHKDMDRLIAHLKQPVQGLSEPQTEPTTQSKPVLRERPLVSLAAPVDMVKVPKGPFLYGDQKIRVVIEHDYWIDKFPVTNAKYRAFIEAGGYEKQQYWSDNRWQWKTKHNITSPIYWNDGTWNKPDHPVVGVSCYEAEAYVKWASKRLPTEREWEKAARGEDGRQYPWGDEFDKNRCNSSESGIGHTTPVSQYPNGISPYGCYDMAGNVLEWCASWYDESQGQRVIRGGSWNNFPEYLLASLRFSYTTVTRLNLLGFRLVQDIP